MLDRSLDTQEKRSISLQEILDAVLRRRTQIGVLILAMVLLGVLYLHTSIPIYTATLDVSPVLGTSGSLSGKSGNLTELASLAGVGLPQSQGDTKFQLYLEGINSYAVAGELSRNTGLMRQLFPREWDEKTQSWKQRADALSRVKDSVKRFIGLSVPAWQPPNSARLKDYIARTVTVAQSPKKLVVTITYIDKNPELAVRFLQALHNAADNTLRRKALARATEYSAYLQKKLNSVTVDDYRSTLIAALTEQEKSIMAASSTTSFSAEQFGPAAVPSRPTSPNGSMILISCVVFGLFFGIIGALLAAVGLLPQFDHLIFWKGTPSL